MTQAIINFNPENEHVVDFVERAFDSLYENDDNDYDFEGAVVRDGNVIPNAAKVLKEAGYRINTLKATGDVAGNLVVGLTNEDEVTLIVYVSDMVDTVDEVLRDAIAPECETDDFVDTLEQDDVSLSELVPPKRGWLSFWNWK